MKEKQVIKLPVIDRKKVITTERQEAYFIAF